ncbi:MAG: hypothetical protein K0S97_195 [Chloroflexota bacterium]|nr:hypothetical protein [Chloroflexota bacterium]
MDQQLNADAVVHPAFSRLEPEEAVQAVANAESASVLVTDRRIAVADGDRLALDIPFDALRRIQFDIERDRPATLVIVPEHPANEPQVIAVPPERFEEVTRALALIGSRLYRLD